LFHRDTVPLLTFNACARSERFFPRFFRSSARLLMTVVSCTTHNHCQQPWLRKPLTTGEGGIGIVATMRKPDRRQGQVLKGRQPNRPHFIAEWAALRGFKDQAALAKASGADKSVVSRWYNGASPSREWQLRLVELFVLNEPTDIFRHPDDDWLAKFFHDRKPEEIDRIKQTLEMAFPQKRGG